MSHATDDGTAAMIYDLLLERNRRETLPFVAIHESHARLLNQVDYLQSKLEAAEREASQLQQDLLESGAHGSNGSAAGALSGAGSPGKPQSKASAAAAQAAVKNEARLRDKLEALQEELNAKLKGESDRQLEALKTSKEISDLKDMNTAMERTIVNLRGENERSERAIEHLTNEVNDAKSRTELAEKQYEGLKRTIRTLQQENDKLSAENRKLEERLMADKGKTVEEMNTLTDLVNALKMEVDMLRSYKIHEDKRRSWFGGGIVPMKVEGGPPSASPTNNGADRKSGAADESRKFGSFGVVLPSTVKRTIAAHAVEGTCVRYDDSGTDLVATASSDSTVKVFDTGTGSCRATLRGTPGHAIISCDVSGSLVVGGGSDKTCRVWNLRTERMVRVCRDVVVRVMRTKTSCSLTPLFAMTDPSPRGTPAQDHVRATLRLGAERHYGVRRPVAQDLGHWAENLPTNRDAAARVQLQLR
jgi:Autophagy protein 16 (ATG16)/WD domain, G-beta repeat